VNHNKHVGLPNIWEVLDCGSQSTALIPLSIHGPSFDTLLVCVPVYISLNTHIAPNLIPGSLCVWARKSVHLFEEAQSDQIERLTYLCHMICEQCVFVSFLYIKFF